MSSHASVNDLISKNYADNKNWQERCGDKGTPVTLLVVYKLEQPVWKTVHISFNGYPVCHLSTTSDISLYMKTLQKQFKSTFIPYKFISALFTVTKHDIN